MTQNVALDTAICRNTHTFSQTEVLQLVIHFADPRYQNVSIILPEDDPLRAETCWSYVYC
jgi:hypothetical protein